MKSETMSALRGLAKMGRWSGWMPVEMAQDILAELKRLRRKSREVTDTDLAVWWDGFKFGRDCAVVDKRAAARSVKPRIAALKKGGRK